MTGEGLNLVLAHMAKTQPGTAEMLKRTRVILSRDSEVVFVFKPEHEKSLAWCKKYKVMIYKYFVELGFDVCLRYETELMYAET